MRQLKILIPMALLGMALTSCGSSGLSNKIEFKALPDSPLIVEADQTIQVNGDPVIIKGPWFEFRYSFKNNSDQVLVVAAIKMTITASVGGVETPTIYTTDAGVNCADGTERSYLAYVVPGATVSRTDCYTEGDTQDTATTYAPPFYEKWLPNGLPPSDNNIYSVQIEAQGWFEKVGTAEITERLTATAYQTTR